MRPDLKSGRMIIKNMRKYHLIARFLNQLIRMGILTIRITVAIPILLNIE